MKFMWGFALVSLFLAVGCLIREIVPLFKKLFIPASIIGGVVYLILGPQVLGVVPVPGDVGKYATPLTIIVLTCSIFGVKFNTSRLRTYLDYTVVNNLVYGMELFTGVAIGAVLSLMWKALPPNWGINIVYSFYGGHGNGAASAGPFTEAGYTDYLGIVLISATIGLIVAMVVGMVLVNWGVRKGYAVYTKKPADLPAYFFGGLMPADKRKSVGEERTSASGINALALQLSLVAVCILVGWTLRWGVATYLWKPFGKVSDVALGILGAVVFWPLLNLFRVDGYVDKKTINNIGALCLEYLITASVATLNLKSFKTYFAPIMIICTAETILCAVTCVAACAKFCREQWFEKMLRLFGQVTGSASTGLALLRCVDPYGESCALDAAGVGGSVLSMPIWVTMIAVGPMLALAENGTRNLLLVGLAIFGVPLAIGLMFFRVRERSMTGRPLE